MISIAGELGFGSHCLKGLDGALHYVKLSGSMKGSMNNFSSHNHSEHLPLSFAAWNFIIGDSAVTFTDFHISDDIKSVILDVMDVGLTHQLHYFHSASFEYLESLQLDNSFSTNSGSYT